MNDETFIYIINSLVNIKCRIKQIVVLQIKMILHTSNNKYKKLQIMMTLTQK